MQLLVATTNRDKIREIRSLLADTPVDLLTLSDIPPVAEPEETGETFQENARLKARYYATHSGMLTVAEDSGLVIDALDGEPGVRSARFLRPDASYPERFAAIFERLAQNPDRPRSARFVCALTVEGTIASAASGVSGCGYDPIFYYPLYKATLAQVDEHQKLAIAHRGQAFRALAEWIRRKQ